VSRREYRDDSLREDRRSGVERRSGLDRRSDSPWNPSVSLESYFERVVGDVERRVVVLERHDEILRERQGDYLTRERYDERQKEIAETVEALRRAGTDSQYLTRERYDTRHAELERALEKLERGKTNADATARINDRVELLEQARREELVIAKQRDLSPGRLDERLSALEKTAAEQVAIINSRDMSRQRLIMTIGAVGGLTSVAMTFILRALGAV
jgi:leucyl aminopeptidase